MPEFTQGKWLYEPATGYIKCEPDRLGREYIEYIAQVLDIDRTNPKSREAIANARLIAKAPDMYALLSVLHHDDAIPETLLYGYRALERAQGIFEAVEGNNIRWDTCQHHKNCSNYFRNFECEFFPCHRNADKDNFNCLFCYCPLYHMEHCPGNPLFLPNGIKDCTNCTLPHTDYNAIIETLKEVNA